MNYTHIKLLAGFALLTFLYCPAPGSAATAPPLGTAKNFAVLGGSTVTNTGSSGVVGDLGVWPGSAITGFPPGTVSGVTHTTDAVAMQAQSDVTTAYKALTGQACDVDLTGQDLGGLTLTSGVYCFSSSAQLTGILTLDAQGNADAVFIFKMGSTITTASASSVVIINGGQKCKVYWQVGSSATIGSTTDFVGNILALTSITMNTGANLNGRALARNGAVTMDTNRIDETLCGGGGANCIPTTCAAQGDNCGQIADGCGGSIDCGVCTSPQTCGGGGHANVCSSPGVCNGPEIWIAQRIIGPPQQIITDVKDETSGLKTITVNKAHNATVSIPAFKAGTKNTVVVTVTKINQAMKASFSLRATNLNGCNTNGDPVLTVLKIPSFGYSVRQTFAGIPYAESFVAIVNGTPGLKTLLIKVNGNLYGKFHFDVNQGRDQEINLNVSSLMAHGENTITFMGYGGPNASALVVISDSGGNLRFAEPETWMNWQTGGSGEDLTWGNEIDQ